MRPIDADELIKTLNVEKIPYNADVNYFIEHAPTIDPVKHGKWVNDKGLYKCSACGELWLAWWAVACPEERMYATMKFCPNCGARMDGGDKCTS